MLANPWITTTQITTWQGESYETNQVLKHKEKLIIFPNHFLQLDHTGVVQLTEGLDLSQRHAFFPAEEFAFHLFDSHLYCQRGSDFALCVASGNTTDAQ